MMSILRAINLVSLKFEIRVHCKIPFESHQRYNTQLLNCKALAATCNNFALITAATGSFLAIGQYC